MMTYYYLQRDRQILKFNVSNANCRRPILNTKGQDLDTNPVTISESGGATVILPCVVRNMPMWERVLWLGPINDYLFADQQKYTTDARITLSKRDRDDYSLQIANVTALDEGVYKCNVGYLKKEITLKVVVSPKILNPKTNKSIAVYEGDKVLLSCTVVGTPQPNITWHRETRNEFGTFVREQLSATGSQLVIYNIERESAGSYICEASNGILPNTQRFINIDVYYEPLAIATASKISQTFGAEIILECIVESNPKPELRWIKDGDEVNNTGRFSTQVIDEGEEFTYHLRIAKLESTDFGRYSCVAENMRGNSSATITLESLDFIRIDSITKDLKAVESETLELSCKASGHPSPTVTWKKYTTKGTLKDVAKGSQLKLKEVNRKDSGVYLCQASNNNTTPVTKNLTLEVEFPPEVSIQPLVKVHKGKEAVVRCVITSNPEPEIMYWSSNDGENKTFEHTMEIKKKKKYTWEVVMRIVEVDTDTFGEYECFAENDHGSTKEILEIVDAATTTTSTTTTTAPTTSSKTTEIKMNKTPKPGTIKEEKPKYKPLVTPSPLEEKSTSRPLNDSSDKSREKNVISTDNKVEPGSVSGSKDPNSGQKLCFSLFNYFIILLVITIKS
ncbi:hypothetical protein FSP39_010535 [Pinctada imbricata]|uniref:Ig-like domain-containing protein n=1 Tax=Pinctada imbricata TaxID=66713 RepID=A0AA88Y492_PINIB|nr:hypothetical protein FSP39_010535 [Pinctada imbricata]